MARLHSVVVLVPLVLALEHAFAESRLPREAPRLPEPAVQSPSDAAGVIPWRILAQVDLVKQDNRYSARFSPEVLGLADKVVKLRGFVFPLEAGDKQKRFLLASSAPTCAFCMPGGPESLVEVIPRDPVKYGFEPITVTGRFTVLKNDPTGLYYRLTDAIALK